jgi:hypothetical protein
MKKILFLLFFYLFSFSLFPHFAFAQSGWTDPCTKEVEVKVCLEYDALGKCKKPGTEIVKVATIQGFECIVQIVLNYAIRLAGIAVFIMLIIGGFKYLTSGGDPKAKEAAQKTITYAIFGLALLLGSWLILLFINEFTGLNVTQFTIPK